ncbi:MAG TPA: DNA polymerase III subunit delta [Stellaceae bacterium]|nr:DNA polymerase III subunit delta [Stellaceae bacterium]
MRVMPARVADFLRRPDPQIRAVLLYGPDRGLVRERAELLARLVCPDLADPFRVAALDAAALAADPARLADEAAQLSLTGGRRVVRVREATDRLAELFADFLDALPGDAFVTVEAGELATRSPLRRAFEAAPRAAAIGCYPDTARDLTAVIRESLSQHRISLDRDALSYLVEHLGEDRLSTRSELEKLALYAGDGGHIALDDARAAVGDGAAIDLDDAVMAAAEGDMSRLERALVRLFQEGTSPVTVIRAVLRHLCRLHLMAAEIAGGAAPDTVMRAARPPIFFKQQDNFRRQLELWSEARLRPELDRLAAAEFHMKTGVFPPEAICRAAMFALAQTAREASRRR